MSLKYQMHNYNIKMILRAPKQEEGEGSLTFV